MANILIIEPNNIIAAQQSKFLKDRGHEVDVCKDVQTAILHADSKAPDIIILELLLKTHNGIEFLYELRSYSEWQDIPVIINSRLPIEECGLTKEAINRLGIKDYFYKPVTKLSKISDKIDRLLIEA